MEAYSGKVVACNASMIIYQSVVATQFNSTKGPNSLSDDAGITNSHLVGIMNKTVQLLDADIRPIWVFDGKVPPLKAKVYADRRETKAKNSGEGQGLVYHPTASGSDSEGEGKSPLVSLIYKQFSQKKRSIVPVREMEVEFAARHSTILKKPLQPTADCPDYCCMGESDSEEYADRELFVFLDGLRRSGDALAVRQASRIAKEMTEDAMLLLSILGVPVIVAPGEAEAQCAALVRSGRAYAVASEEMDSLVFGSRLLLRGLNSEKKPFTEINLDRVLNDMTLSMPQFIDLCIFLGCDYGPNINGAGPATALKLIKQYGSLEKVLGWVSENKKKWTVPDNFPVTDVRNVFMHPDVYNPMELEVSWTQPDEAQLKTFLLTTKGFAMMKVDYGLRKAKKLQGRPMQKKLDSYFGEKRKGGDNANGGPYKVQKRLGF